METRPVPDTDLIAPDMVLLLIASPTARTAERNRLSGITRLEKLLFLADKETEAAHSVIDPFVFQPYDFGPYSKAVYEAVELLEQAGLLREESVFEGQALDEMEESIVLEESEGVERRFSLTEQGAAVAGLLAGRHPNEAEQLATIRAKYGDLSLRQLIRYVYNKYPAYAEESKIRDQIL